MKRGFTLIELLAVLTILSIIMLIAVPIVAGIIKNSKEKTREQSVELYGRAIENAINTYYVKYPLKNEVTLETLETEKLIDYKGTEVKCNIVRIEERDVYLEDCKVGNKNIDATYGKYIPEIATADDYRGYYADVDGDGNADGIIYADLGANIEYPQSGTWGQSYTYNKAIGELNEYTISKNKHNGNFGEKAIIKLKKDKDNPRFYVMALEDFTTGSLESQYYWYYNARNHMNPIITELDFGTGKENTGKMIKKWKSAGTSEGYSNSPQDDYDMWKHIQGEYEKGWYIPSRGEWAAFGDYFITKINLETKLTTSNYNSIFGLSDWYWSSSQCNNYSAWYVSFVGGQIANDGIEDDSFVRLGMTF